MEEKKTSAENQQLKKSYDVTVKKMNAELKKFSKSLSRDDFEEALRFRK